MKRGTSLFLCCLTAFFFGCGPRGNDGALPVLDVSQKFPERTIPLQELAEVEYLALETNDEFLLSESPPAYFDEQIVVMTEYRSGNVIFFDRRTGKALHKFNRKGRGGQEYARLERLTVDRAKGEVFIFAGEWMLVYDFQGNFRRRWEVPSESYFSSISDCNETELLVYDSGKKTGQSIYALSKQDGTVREFGLPPAADSVEFKTMLLGQLEGVTSTYPITLSPSPQLIRTARGYLLGRPTVSDTLYSLNPKENRLSPALVRQPSIFDSDPPTPLSLIAETDRRFLLNVTTVPREFSDIKSASWAYDKATGECYPLKINQQR